jgi:hypothetical protein
MMTISCSTSASPVAFRAPGHRRVCQDEWTFDMSLSLSPIEKINLAEFVIAILNGESPR